MSLDVVHPHYDVAVLGAGAAGLMAAARAAECGARVVLLEKNRKPGVKILMSGGTRCNVTNVGGLYNRGRITGPVDPAIDVAKRGDVRKIQAAFSPAAGAFLGPALRKFDVDRTVAMFEAEGVPLKVEANGKIFPASDRAVDVLAALMRRLQRSGTEVRYLSPVKGLERDDEGFRIDTPTGSLTAKRVILAIGGRSYPGCGTTGDGYTIAQSFGHTIVPPRPALVPLKVGTEWATALRGISLPDVVVSVHDSSGSKLLERREAILFTHAGLSGPAVMDVSREAAAGAGDRRELRIDFYPDIAREEIDRRLQAGARKGKSAVASILSADLPHRLAECILDECGIPRSRTGPDLSRDERLRLASGLKGLAMPVVGTLGYEKAEVTAGGVELAEVDGRTMESRLATGLFLAGEVLDVDGWIGGYNFQAAWSTGWLAGESAAKGLT